MRLGDLPNLKLLLTIQDSAGLDFLCINLQ